MTVHIGDKVPDFTLPNQDDKALSLSDLKGKNVVLYFYPKDMTSGCTQEACDFRDNMERLQSSDTVLLGVSKDSAKSHGKFRDKYELPFDLLADTDGTVCEAFGTWVEKSMYGRKYMGIERSTFLIDSKGVLRNEWRKVKVKGHVDEVLKALAAL